MAEQQSKDPQNPASKPQGTLHDQEATMEGEGQAATPGQDPRPMVTSDPDAPRTPPSPREDVGSRRGQHADDGGEDTAR